MLRELSMTEKLQPTPRASLDSLSAALNRLASDAPSASFRDEATALIEQAARCVAHPDGRGFSGVILSQPGRDALPFARRVLETTGAPLHFHVPGDAAKPAHALNAQLAELAKERGLIVVIENLGALTTEQFDELREGVLSNRGRWSVVAFATLGSPAPQPGFEEAVSMMQRAMHLSAENLAQFPPISQAFGQNAEFRRMMEDDGIDLDALLARQARGASAKAAPASDARLDASASPKGAGPEQATARDTVQPPRHSAGAPRLS